MDGNKKHTSSIPPGIEAAAAYFFPFVGGLVMLAIEKEDRFVRFHAAQSLLFWIFAIPIAVLSWIPIIGFIGDLLSLAFVVAWIFLIYQAWTLREFEIPYLGAIAREQVFGKETPSAAREEASEEKEPEADKEREEPPL